MWDFIHIGHRVCQFDGKKDGVWSYQQVRTHPSAIFLHLHPHPKYLITGLSLHHTADTTETATLPFNFTSQVLLGVGTRVYTACKHILSSSYTTYKKIKKKTLTQLNLYILNGIYGLAAEGLNRAVASFFSDFP